MGSSSDEVVEEKPPERDQRASRGAKQKKQKRGKLASTKSEAFKEKADAIENGDEEGGKGADFWQMQVTINQTMKRCLGMNVYVFSMPRRLRILQIVRNSGLNMNMNRFAYAKTQRARGEQSNT